MAGGVGGGSIPLTPTNLNIANFAGSLLARSPRLRRGFARIFPYISAQNQMDGQNQKSVFYPAGGQKGRGCGGRNFYPPAFRAEGAAGVGNGSFLFKQEDKARKNFFLKRKDFLRVLIKRKRNFCGLCPPRGGDPLGGISARQGRNSCSKWVRTSFSNCDCDHE